MNYSVESGRVEFVLLATTSTILICLHEQKNITSFDAVYFMKRFNNKIDHIHVRCSFYKTYYPSYVPVREINMNCIAKCMNTFVCAA